jgi:transposase
MSVRKAAKLIGKDPSTVQRWKATNPELYAAVMEYAAKRQVDQKPVK